MLSENAHLPFDKLMALSKVEGLRYPHPSSLRRTSMYASFLGISEALHLDIFHQPLRSRFFDSFRISLWAVKEVFSESYCHYCSAFYTKNNMIKYHIFY
jgi:hypothetical protein